MISSRLGPPAAAVVSGALYALLLPPFEHSALAWVALVPLLWALARGGSARGAVCGLLWAATATLGVAWWFPAMLERYFALSPLTAWTGLAGLAVVVDGWPYAAFGAFVGWAARRGAANPLTIACAWGAAEWARANGPVPNPFAQIAYSQSGTPIAQLADLAGPYGIGMLLAAVNASVAGLVAPALGGERPRARVALALASLALAFAYGEVRLQQEFGEGEDLQVAVVQGAVAREVEWDAADRDRHLDRYLDLTWRARRSAPDIVFWPEFAVDFYLREPTVQRARLLDGVRAVGADLVLGGSHYRLATEGAPAGETEYLNSIFVVNARGQLRAERYDKRRLVPFAEYGPFGDLLRGPTAIYASGGEPRLLQTSGLRLGAFICGEALYPEVARELSLRGAQLLANPSNDYWFGHPQAAAHQLQVASFRAIENRRYLVRPTSTGISAVVDPHGRALARSEAQGPELLHARLRASSTVTPYQRVGDAPVLAAAVLGVAGVWRTRRIRTPEPGGQG